MGRRALRKVAIEMETPKEMGNTAAPAEPAPAGASAAAPRSGRFEWRRRGTPWVRDGGAAFGNWLATIGWGKFFLLSVLLLIFSNLSSSFFFSSGKSGEKIFDDGSISVDVHVVPLADGRLLIQSAAPPASAGHRGAGTPPPARPAVPEGDRDVILQINGEGTERNPAVRIDKQGVRVLADDAGHKVSVVVDHNGVRVEQLPDAKTGAAGAPPATVPAPGAAHRGEPLVPALDADPEKIAGAVEAARSGIEALLQDQVDTKLQALHRDERVERENWVVLLTTMAIVALIALKVVLGSKSRAEFQARKASATAAQEGLKRQLAEAQLKMMQAQVEPHFLFNTLASVDYLIETDPARASRMQKNLIQYLRAALPQMREGSSTLEREILQCRSYLEILKVRMDERLQFSINVPQGLLTASFPPMMLLTLVENAIKHGLEPKPDGGTLSLSAIVADGRLRVAVADSGLGFGVAQRGGTGVGLANVRERLAALYGAAGHADDRRQLRRRHHRHDPGAIPRRGALGDGGRRHSGSGAGRMIAHRPGGPSAPMQENIMSGVLMLVAGALAKGFAVLALIGGGLLAAAFALLAVLAVAALALLLGAAAGALGLVIAALVIAALLGVALLPLALPVLLLYLLVRPRRPAAPAN